jgi:NADH-quinone oxidoreductase subunit J
VSPETAAFLVLAAIAVVTALLALLVRELVHTILWVATFFVVLAALYFLLLANFIGILQLGVYAGAVTILLLFGVMTTRKRIFSREAATGIGPASVVLGSGIVIVVAILASALASGSSSTGPVGYAPQLLSQALFGSYGPWLLLVGLVMLAALGGAIYLVREGRE